MTRMKRVNVFLEKLTRNINDVAIALRHYVESHTSEEAGASYDNVIAMLKMQQLELANDIKKLRGNAREVILAQVNAIEGEIEKAESQKREIYVSGNTWHTIRNEIEETISWLARGDIDFANVNLQKKRQILMSLMIKIVVNKTGKRMLNHEIYSDLGINAIRTLSSNP